MNKTKYTRQKTHVNKTNYTRQKAHANKTNYTRQKAHVNKTNVVSRGKSPFANVHLKEGKAYNISNLTHAFLSYTL